MTRRRWWGRGIRWRCEGGVNTLFRESRQKPVELLARKVPAVQHHGENRAGVVDGLQRIRVEEDQIGELARGDGTELALAAQVARWIDGRGAEGVEWRHPRTDEQRELVVQTRPGVEELAAEIRPGQH